MITQNFKNEEIKVIKTDLAYFRLYKKPYKNMKILEEQTFIDILKKEENNGNSRSKQSIIKEKLGMEKRVKSYLENLLSKIVESTRKTSMKMDDPLLKTDLKHFINDRKDFKNKKSYYSKEKNNLVNPPKEVLIPQSRDKFFMTRSNYETKMQNYEIKKKLMNVTFKEKSKKKREFSSLNTKNYRLNQYKEKDQAYMTNLCVNQIKENYCLKK